MLKTMEDNRIIHVKDIAEVAALINKQFKEYFPIPLRGAIASLNGTIDLSYRSEGQIIKLEVKDIGQILKDGTELDFDSQFGWTRVDYYPRQTNWAFIYAKNRSRINNWVERAEITSEKTELLKPIIIVYDKSILTKPQHISHTNIHNEKLPQNLDDRSKAILAIYVNHTKETEDWTNIPF